MLDPKSNFARLRVKRVWQEPVVSISEEDAAAEGYPGALEFLNAFAAINGIKDFDADGNDPLLKITVWCVKFEVVDNG